MAPLEKLLVAVDGSKSAMKAADFAIDIARNRDCKVVALNVVVSERGYGYASGMLVPVTPSSINELLQKSHAEAESWMETIRLKAASAGVEFGIDVVATPISVVPAIIDYAEKNAFSLIIVGSRGRSSFAKRLLGSVASGVVSGADRPVMIVK